MAPELRLVQYKFFERGRRNRDAIQDYMKDVVEPIWLHSDGAPLYKCYDVGETVVRVACAVHMRRPFWKLKGTSAETDTLVELFNSVFHQESMIKSMTDDMAERKRLRNERIGGILLELKNHLDRLASELRKENDPDLLKAVNYAQKEYPCLLHCLEDASLEWSNNICEQQMRTIAAYRNASNALGSVESAERFARLMSYAQSCRLNMVNFGDWIGDVLRRLANGESASADMLPNKWVQTTENVNLLKIKRTKSELGATRTE